MSQRTATLVRRLAIALFGFAVAFTLLGGLGNTCVAFNAEKYGKAFEKFISYKSEYQMMVYVGVVTSLVGFVALWGMVKGKSWGFPLGLVVLLVGVAAAVTQMYYTSTIKQVSFFKTPPTNMRFYTTLLSLILLLLVRLPGIWKWVDFTKAGSDRSTGTTVGLASCVMGALTITTPLWAGPSHMVDGYNLVYVLEWPLLLGGCAMIVGGLAAVLFAREEAPVRRVIERLWRAHA